jgi:hypothetical protein
MVDALRSAGRVLRQRGRIVDLRPVLARRATIAIRRGQRRLAMGAIVRDPDPDVAAAARAVRDVVRAGEFALVHKTGSTWVATHPNLADIERALASTESWRLPAATRRRIVRAWRSGDTIQVTRRFAVVVLRRHQAVR